MYTEENEKRYDLRSILLKVIFGLIIVLLIIWLIPKFTGNNKDTLVNTPSYEAVYKDNLDSIKEASLNYYSEDKLPINQNEVVNITVEQLIIEGYLEEMIDADQKSCNINDSFVSIEYIENQEYELFIRLICDKQSQGSSYTVYKNTNCSTTLCNEEPTTTQPEDNEDEKDESTEEEGTKQPVTNNTTTITQYEYYFVTPTSTSEWSAWSDWKQDPTKTITSSKCNNNDTTCNSEVESKVEFITTGTKEIPYYQTYKALINKGTYTNYVCTNSTYQQIDNVLYRYTGGEFKLVGQINTKTPPQDTYNTRYEFVGLDDSACGMNCYDDLESYVYNKYVYSGTVEKYNSNTTCTKKTTTVTIYKTTDTAAGDTRVENINQYVRFYRERSRTISQEQQTNYKWSSYNDQSLLSSGWNYTGKTK